MTQRFSARTCWDTRESSYAAAVREARASSRRIYDLTLSNPTRCGFRMDAATLLAPLTNPAALRHDPDPSGLRSAREAIADYYAGHHAVLNPDALVLTTSTSEAYSFLFRLLCDPGDEILIAQPGYPLFDFIAALDDVRLRPYPLFYDRGWWIDFAELERSLTPRTRAIVVVHPNNPTGHWTSPSERHQLEQLCARHDLCLIVDEVFLDYPLTEAVLPGSFAAGEHPALTFVLSGISKILGLPQMKAAWIATLGPEPQCTAALVRLEIIADTFLSMNAPVQLALPVWLESRAAMQTQILSRIRANLDTLASLASAHPDRLRLLDCDAGWSAVLALPACVGEPACAERLLRQRGVITHPGSFYGMADAQRLVVSLLGPPDDLVAGISLAIA